MLQGWGLAAAATHLERAGEASGYNNHDQHMIMHACRMLYTAAAGRLPG
jgi:hypothetical protein